MSEYDYASTLEKEAFEAIEAARGANSAAAAYEIVTAQAALASALFKASSVARYNSDKARLIAELRTKLTKPLGKQHPTILSDQTVTCPECGSDDPRQFKVRGPGQVRCFNVFHQGRSSCFS